MGCLVAANLAEKLKERIVASVWIGPIYPGGKLAEVFRYVFIPLFSHFKNLIPLIFNSLFSTMVMDGRY